MAKYPESYRRHELHSMLEPLRVDEAQGIIYGVTVITSDVDAKGHDLRVDETTLTQLKECADTMGRVPVKWNHRTGADAVNGYLENFRVVESTSKGRPCKKLLGDWYLLKSHDRYDHAIELATRMPKMIGLSAAFLGEDEVRGGKTLARCSELLSVDLVANPAANPDGLLEAKFDGIQPASVDNKTIHQTDMDPKTTPASNEPATLESIAASLSALTQSFTEHKAAQESLNSQFTEALAGEGAEGAEDGDGISMEQLLAMSPEQLEATLDEAVASGEINAQQAQNIWATVAANSEAGEGDPAGDEGFDGGEAGGEGAMAGVAGGGEGGTALNSLYRKVNELSARFEREDRETEEAETAKYFEVVEHSLAALSTEVKTLKELNANLAIRNEALLKSLRTGVRPLAFSAEGADLKRTETGELHEFDAAVQKHKSAGKSEAQAVLLAARENPAAHRDWVNGGRGGRASHELGN